MEPDKPMDEEYGWPQDDDWAEHYEDELSSFGANIADDYGRRDIPAPYPDDILQDTEFPQDISAPSPGQPLQWTREELSLQEILGRAMNDHEHVFDQMQQQYNFGAPESDYINSANGSFPDVRQPPNPSQTGSTASTQQPSHNDGTASLTRTTTSSTETIADNAQPLRCTVHGCPSKLKNLKNEKNLERHRQRCHEQPKVPCPDCGKLYSPSGHMKRHSRTHTAREEWKFTCDLCKRKCQRKDQLERHRGNNKCIKAQKARQRIASSPSPSPESSAMAAGRLQQRPRATLLPADRAVSALQGSASSTHSRVEASTSANVSGTDRPRPTPTTHPTPSYFVPPPGMGPFILPPDLGLSLPPSGLVLCVLPSGLGIVVHASSLLDPSIVAYLLNEQALVVFAPSVASLPSPLSGSVQPHEPSATLASRADHPRPSAEYFISDQQLESLDPRLRPPTEEDSAGGNSVSSTMPPSVRVQSEQPPSGQPLPEHSNAAVPNEADSASSHGTENSPNNQTGSSGRRWKGKGRERE